MDSLHLEAASGIMLRKLGTDTVQVRAAEPFHCQGQTIQARFCALGGSGATEASDLTYCANRPSLLPSRLTRRSSIVCFVAMPATKAGKLYVACEHKGNAND